MASTTGKIVKQTAQQLADKVVQSLGQLCQYEHKCHTQPGWPVARM